MAEPDEKGISESESESELSSSECESPIDKWQKLEEELTCFSCDKLFSQPKTIPCLHTFCADCIHVAIDKETKKFCCPMCKAKFDESQLKSCRVNVSLEYLVGIVKKHNVFVEPTLTVTRHPEQDSFVVSCAQCVEGAPATKWCLACEDAEMCDECYRSHSRLKIFQDHKVISLNDFIESPDQVLSYCPLQEGCRYHRNQVLKFYCHQCLRFVCQQCQCVSDDLTFYNHKCDSVDKVYETEINLEKLQETLQPIMPRFEAALEKNKTADQELENCMAKEVAWIQERFQVIRKVIDKYEESLLQNIEAIKNNGKSILETQKADLIQLQNQLVSCDRFISGVLQPCRSGEMIAYYKWIEELAVKLTMPCDLDPAYNVEDLLITRHHISAKEVVGKLGTLDMHQAFHQPHLPNCTASLTSKCIVPVVLKVVMKDKYNLPVPNQLSLLKVWPKNLDGTFFTNFQKWCGKKGVYYFSYFPKVKEPHEILVTWKSEPLGDGQCIRVTGTFDYSAMFNGFRYLERYNKRNLKKPEFLSLTPDGSETIVSDPADNRLIVFAGEYFCYQYVITNDNNVFHPCGSAVAYTGYLYVADSFYNCILKFKRSSFSKRYENSYFSRFGRAGSEDGQFNCPQGLVISKSNFIFICDKNNHRIQTYSITNSGEDEEFSFSFGKFGQEPGCFNHPTDVTLNRVKDTLFVADTDNHRVQTFTLSGQLLTTFPHHYQGIGTSTLKFNRNAMRSPVGICSGIDGRILVNCKYKVFVFEEDGTQVTNINFYKDPAGIIVRDTGYTAIALTQSSQIA